MAHASPRDEDVYYLKKRISNNIKKLKIAIINYERRFRNWIIKCDFEKARKILNESLNKNICVTVTIIFIEFFE